MATGTLEHIDLDEYRTYLERRTRHNTVLAYMTGMTEFSDWLGDEPPDREAAQEFIDYLQRQGKSPNTLAIKANAIRRWFKWKGSPVFLDVPTAPAIMPKYITEDELNTLIKVSRDALERVLVIGSFDSACRVSEWIGIDLDDIDWEHGLVRVTGKGGTIAWVNVSKVCLDALTDWLSARKSRSKHVFMDLGPRDARAIIRSVGERAGIKLTPHMFRHSRAVQMLLAGADPYVVQQHLRHRNINTTLNIYGQLFPMHLKKKIPEWKKGG